MKTCIKKCGIYSDSEIRCPVCNSRLFRIKDTTNQNASNTSGGTGQGQQGYGQNNSQQNNTTGNSNHQNYNPNYSQNYNTNLNNNPNLKNNTNYGGYNYSANNINSNGNYSSNNYQYGNSFTQYGMGWNNSNNTNSTNTNQANTQSSVQNVRVKSNEITGQVVNLQRQNRRQTKFENFFESLINGTPMINSDMVTVFDVVEIDANGKQTGRILNFSYRGEIKYGSIQNGDNVTITGKKKLNGSYVARKIYNNSNNSSLVLNGAVPFLLIILLIGVLLLLGTALLSQDGFLSTVIILIIAGFILKNKLRRH